MLVVVAVVLVLLLLLSCFSMDGKFSFSIERVAFLCRFDFLPQTGIVFSRILFFY